MRGSRAVAGAARLVLNSVAAQSGGRATRERITLGHEEVRQRSSQAGPQEAAYAGEDPPPQEVISAAELSKALSPPRLSLFFEPGRRDASDKALLRDGEEYHRRQREEHGGCEEQVSLA